MGSGINVDGSLSRFHMGVLVGEGNRPQEIYKTRGKHLPICMKSRCSWGQIHCCHQYRLSVHWSNKLGL